MKKILFVFAFTLLSGNAFAVIEEEQNPCTSQKTEKGVIINCRNTITDVVYTKNQYVDVKIKGSKIDITAKDNIDNLGVMVVTQKSEDSNPVITTFP
jgi:hypothetical protein